MLLIIYNISLTVLQVTLKFQVNFTVRWQHWYACVTTVFITFMIALNACHKSSVLRRKHSLFLEALVLQTRTMEKDIDELLEEVENKFINKNNEDRPRKLLTANTFSSESSFRYLSSLFRRSTDLLLVLCNVRLQSTTSRHHDTICW